jgi:Metallo-peptidase family M12B Reprolysin-like
MPSLLDSCRVVQLPASVRQLAREANLQFPLSLRQFIADQQCPFSQCVRIHLKTLQAPTVPVPTMLLLMRAVYATADIGVIVGSRETLSGPNFALLLDLDVGPCQRGTTSAEQNQLFQSRANAGANDIVVYFTRSVLQNNATTLNGCASFPTGRPGVAVAQVASRWTMAHEVGHALGLNHFPRGTCLPADCPPQAPAPTRLMTCCGTARIVGTATISQGEIDTMRDSDLSFQC